MSIKVSNQRNAKCAKKSNIDCIWSRYDKTLAKEF